MDYNGGVYQQQSESHIFLHILSLVFFSFSIFDRTRGEWKTKAAQGDDAISMDDNPRES